MRVNVEEISTDFEIGKNGIKLKVSNGDSKQVGKLLVTKTRVVWFAGREGEKNKYELTWEDFQELMKKHAQKP